MSSTQPVVSDGIDSTDIQIRHQLQHRFADATQADLSTLRWTPESKLLIELTFPIQEVSHNAQKERNSPTYNLNRIHQYWSRKPLGYCRATIYASLVPAAEAGSPELQRQLDNLVKLSAPETAFDTSFLTEIQQELQTYYQDSPDGVPGIFDPFAGGGSIPLEAKRLGLGAKYEDSNELAQFIEHLILEVGPKLEAEQYCKIQALIPTIFDELEEELAEYYPTKSFTARTVSSAVRNEIEKINIACAKEKEKLALYYQKLEETKLQITKNNEKKASQLEKKREQIAKAEIFLAKKEQAVNKQQQQILKYTQQLEKIQSQITKNNEKKASQLEKKREQIAKAEIFLAKKEQAVNKQQQQILKYTQQLDALQRLEPNTETFAKLEEIQEQISKSSKRIANLDRDWFAEPWVPVFYYWARIGKCSNPNCSIAYPLMPKWSLDEKRGVTFYPSNSEAGKPLEVEIVNTKTVVDFEHKHGTVKRGKGICPVCGSITESSVIKTAIKEHPQDFFPLGVRYSPKISTSNYETELRWLYEYVSAKPAEILAEIDIASEEYCRRKTAFRLKHGYDCEPESGWDPRPGFDYDGGHRLATLLSGWNDLLSTRQKLFYITLVDKLLSIRERGDVTKDEFAVLGLVGWKLMYVTTTTGAWNTIGAPQCAGPMQTNLPWNYNFAERCSNFRHPVQSKGISTTIRSGAESLAAFSNTRFSINIAAAENFYLITDPPYYDTICYSPLSDFYYTWERAVYRKEFRKFFANPTTSKINDLSYTIGKQQFEDGFKQKLEQFRLEAGDNGSLTLMFAHSSTEVWEKTLELIFKSGFAPTAVWPVNTESVGRSNLRATKLHSTITIYCRVVTKAMFSNSSSLDAVLELVTTQIHQNLRSYAKQCIKKPDQFFAALASTCIIYSRYTEILDSTGTPVAIDAFLKYIPELINAALLQDEN